jgi:hypothetical protein
MDIGYTRVEKAYIQQVIAIGINAFSIKRYGNNSSLYENKIYNRNEREFPSQGVLMPIHAIPTVINSRRLNSKYFSNIFIPTNNEITTKIVVNIP